MAFLIGLGAARGASDENAEKLVVPRIPPTGSATVTETLDRPRWIRHVVAPRERLTQIALRYGVSVAWIVEWNELDPARPRIKKNQKLRVRARRIPPARQKIEVEVKAGDTFGTLAADYRVEFRDLLAYNWRVKELVPGMQVTIWVDPEFPPRTVNLHPGPPIPEAFDVPEGARSVGRPQRGRLLHGVPLPASALYTIREPAIAWASSHTVRVMLEAFARFRHDSGYEGQVLIGSISRRRGGRFPPHKSHQSGRDIDIRLPLLPGVVDQINPHPDEVDWSASWELVKAFVDTGQIVAIYLEIPLQRRMFQAAMWEGMTPEELVPYLQWPSKVGHAGAIVRHERGHDGHIHVRLKCGPDEPRCRGS